MCRAYSLTRRVAGSKTGKNGKRNNFKGILLLQ